MDGNGKSTDGLAFKGPSVEFTDIEYSFPVKRKGKKGKYVTETLVALKKMSGKFDTGKLTCIMGPSGSGKTTLLNLMAGRAGKSSISGSTLNGAISLNGKVIDPVKERDQFAYVMSEDALFATLTPRESLLFAAKMRLPNLSHSEKVNKVEALIEALGISKCADTLIGNEIIKGISSGERKRTAVGIELVHDPLLCLLDEPTSGLDSYMAYQLIMNLRKIADHGRSVICTIHQPRSEIFELFDDVMFISAGSLVYHGPVKQVKEYFGAAGYACPPNHNPADYVMYLIQTLPQDKLSELVARWDMTAVNGEILAKRERCQDKAILHTIDRSSIGQQLVALMGREVKNTLRNTQIIIMRFVATAIMSCLFGGVFWMVSGTAVYPDPNSVWSYVGAITFVCIQAMFANVQPVLLSFPREKPIFIREHSSGFYHAWTYFLCKCLVDLPMVFLQSLLAIVIIYFMMGFDGNFGNIVRAHFLIGYASGSVAVMISSRVSNMKTALELAPLCFIPQIFFSGVFITLSQVPAALRWLQYIMPLKYGVNLMYLAEFNNPSNQWIADYVFPQNDVYPGDEWKYLLIISCLIVAFRGVGLLSLMQKSRSTVF